MTEEKFNQIKNLRDNIDRKKSSIRTIESLISSCGISCKIIGTPKSCRSTIEYHFSNKDEIKKLLIFEKEKIEFDLQELEKMFSEL